jgi:murein DD-endopeptidase MepM/ murein hydrolase activator NlpD
MAAPQRMTLPVSGKITSPFGQRIDPKSGKPRNHRGVDIAAPVGTSVKATGSGTILKVGWENPKNHKQGYGQRIIIDHGKGNISIVGHLSEIAVKKGDKVSRGQEIGKSGDTGKSTGPHVHYEERHNGKPHAPTGDPASFAPNARNAPNNP